MDAKLEWNPNEQGFEDAIMCLTLQYGAARINSGRRYSPHYHPHIEMLYGVEGVATVIIGGKRHKMGKGDLIIVNSKYAHDVFCEVGECKYYVVKFLPEALYLRGRSLAGIRYLLPLWQKQLDLDPAVKAGELAGSGIDGLICEIMEEWNARSSGFEAVIYADIMKIFIWMVRRRGQPDTGYTGLTKELQEALGLAIEKAQKHLCDFSAADAAKACNLSYSYFSRSFKKAYGVSFSSYFESIRLREAERLLLTTDRDITDIAAAVGFATTSYFIERFRIAYGTTPNVFRREYGAK